MKIEIAGLCGAMVSSSKRLFPVFSWPPHMHASFLCCRHARFGAVADLLPFELREHGQLAVEHAALGLDQDGAGLVWAQRRDEGRAVQLRDHDFRARRRAEQPLAQAGDRRDDLVRELLVFGELGNEGEDERTVGGGCSTESDGTGHEERL